MRFTKILPPFLIFLLLGVGGWRLSQYIASKHQAFQGREFAQAHPLLDWLGPGQSATQGGYTMLAVQDAAQPFQFQDANGNSNYQSGGDFNGRGNTAFWFRMDSPPGSVPSYASSRSTQNANLLTVTAYSSTGDTFPLDWELNSGQPDPFFHVTLPAGYPNTYRWIDLTVADRQGHTATWRINHLPPTQHLIPAPVRVQSTYKNGGVTLTASAWRQRDPYNQPHPITAMYQMRGLIRPYQHQWEVAFVGHQWEWGSANAPPQSGTLTEGFSDKGEFNNGEDSVVGGYSGQALPYLDHNHYVRLLCELHQFEIYTETVTFHNVPIQAGRNGRRFIAPAQPVSRTTPSGITVTLTDPRALPLGSFPPQEIGQAGINFSADYTPKVGAGSLGKSPLYRRYGKVVTVSLAAQPPRGFWQTGGMNIGQAQINTFSRQTGMSASPITSRLSPDGKTIQTFTLSVQQRVDLQKVPVTFTLPILPHRPKTLP